jgi:pimeloyl-ACP methyl ester carboxylesterase
VDTFGADYLVGHSLGAMTVAREAGEIPELRAVALYAVPDELSVLGQNFCRRVKMSPASESRFLARLSRNTPDGLGRESVTRYLAEFEGPVLLLHDEDDMVIPLTNSERISERYDLELIRTSGLGHRQIIRDPQLADRVVAFLQDK